MKIEELKKAFDKIIKVNYIDKNEAEFVLNNLELDSKYFGYEYELFRRALIFDIKGNYNESLKSLEEAIEVAYSNNSPYIIDEASMLLAFLNVFQTNYEIAFKLYVSVNNYQENPRILNNIGDIYSTIGDYEEAYKYIKKADVLIGNVKKMDKYDIRLKTIIKSNLAESQYKFGDFEGAISTAYDCVEFAKVNNEGYGKATALNLLGQIYLTLQNYDKAIDIFKQSTEEYNSCSLMNMEMLNYYMDGNKRWHAKALSLKDKHQESNELAYSIVTMHKEDYELLISNYEVLGLYDKAYQTYKDYLGCVKQKESQDAKIRSESFKSKVKVFETEQKISEYELLYKNTKSISEIGKQIISSDNLDDTFEAIYSHINSIMEFDTIGIGKIDNDKKYLNYDWIYEYNQLSDPIKVDIKDKNRFSSWVVRNKKAIKINEALTSKEVLKYKEEIKPFNQGLVVHSIIICPIILKNDIYGILSVQSSQKFQYTEYDLEVLKMLASFISVAMKNWNDTELLQRANQKLEVLSKTDALTGISNRHVLSEIVENLFKKKDGVNNQLSVVMIDIDHFKEFNDTYGHIEGDRCLIKIVDELVKKLDDGKNRLFRYGGDEFVAIIPYMSNDEVIKILEETRKNIEDLMIANRNSEVSKYVTCSYGFTTVTKSESMDYQKAFYLADKALYVSKANGKNRIAFEKGI